MKNFDPACPCRVHDACPALGACLAFWGVAGGVPLLYGSAGCARALQEYLAVHFRETPPLVCAMPGHPRSLFQALDQCRQQFRPAGIGVVASCRAGDETELRSGLREYRQLQARSSLPKLVPISPVPGGAQTAAGGLDLAVRDLVRLLADGDGAPQRRVNLLPGLVSPADLHYLKEIFQEFELSPILLPDYSDLLDGPFMTGGMQSVRGGVPLSELSRMGRSSATIEFSLEANAPDSAAGLLRERFGVPRRAFAPPIGPRLTDALFDVLQDLSGRPCPVRQATERKRLLDAMNSNRRLLSGKRAILFGEEDLVAGLAILLDELGLIPLLGATPGDGERLTRFLRLNAPNLSSRMKIIPHVNSATLDESVLGLRPDVLLAASDRPLPGALVDTPLIRIGFPIGDRIGGPRLLHLGYRGALQLLERIVDALAATRPEQGWPRRMSA